MYEASYFFSLFIKYGEQTEYDKSIRSYSYQLEKEKAENNDFDGLKKALSEVNKTISLSLMNGFYRLEFEDGSGHWEEDYKNYFYPDLEYFMRSSIRKKGLPSRFCIANEKLSETDLINEPLLKKVNYLVKWVKLLADMADHIQDNKIFVFFVYNKDGKTKPYEVSPFITLSQLEKIELNCDDKRYSRLSDSWHLEDAQTKDRQSVMLVSFAEIMASIKDGDNPFEVFLSNTKKFHDRYCENYEIYVNRFTVDSQLREIDEQHLSFVGKLQDLVTSSQTKAFALPGVMVAIGALARVNNIVGILAITVGVVMTKILISKSNELLRDNLDHFKDTFDRALGHYVKSRTEAEEVKSHAMDAQEKLNGQLTRARERIAFIDTMSNWMIFIGLLLALIMFLLRFFP